MPEADTFQLVVADLDHHPSLHRGPIELLPGRPPALRARGSGLISKAALAHQFLEAVEDLHPVGVTEYFVIVSASNRRLVRTLVDEIEVQTREHTGRSPLRSEGVRENQWVLVDYGDVVVHVFLAEVREFYEIERLYTDVPKVDWSDAATA